MGIRRVLLALAFAGFAIAMAVIVALFAASTLRAQSSAELDELLGTATETQRFSLLKYELTHLPNRWLTNVAGWVDEPEFAEDTILQRWFERGDERDRKAAELLLERRLSRAVSELELDSRLPLFGRVRVVWPPIDVDLSEPLRVLAVSPRDEVRMVRSVLLTSEVQLEDYERIESVVEADQRWSAWVGRVSGVALYPASVVSSRDYLSTLRIMAHEWTHHHLAFYPLGLAYGRGSDMRTINETVADIVGDQLGRFAAQLPGHEPASEPERDAALIAIRTETDPILRDLRIEVDALLAEDQIVQAERRMEEVRLELIGFGRPFRRINQAFLAFRGGYGASAASASPWGDRLLAYRESSDSLSGFVEAIREVGSAEEADILLPR